MADLDPWLTLFVLLLGGTLFQVLFYYPRLPDRVAVRFDLGGEPRSYWPKLPFVMFWLVLVYGLSAAFFLVRASVPLWHSCGVLAFLMGLYQLTVRANVLTGRLGKSFWIWIALFLAFILSVASTSKASAAEPRPAPPRSPSIDAAQAIRIFKEVQAISDKDGGKMWGKPLYGATLFVDETTREVVANRPDYQNLLKPQGDAFVGTLPTEENVANTATRWGGVDWTMVRWPLPENPLERDSLLIHESFHRIQDDLGLGGPDTANDHLDTQEGRLWLQLEWRALRTALLQRKDARKKAEQDALLFRAYRRSLFKDSAAHEQALEMHEGLPEYTGIALCAKSRAEAEAYAAARLEGAGAMATFVRSFAYMTGPAYGILLDEAKPEWRKGLKGTDDLGDLLAAALGMALPSDLETAASGRAQAYGGKELTAAEQARAAKKAQQDAAMRQRFMEGPVLNLPLTQAFSYSFDPTNQVPLEGIGTVYPTLRISAEWGILEATQGALMLMKEGMISGVRVSAPKDPAARPLAGEGWTLTLKEGWSVVPGKRPGDLGLKKTALGPI